MLFRSLHDRLPDHGRLHSDEEKVVRRTGRNAEGHYRYADPERQRDSCRQCPDNPKPERHDNRRSRTEVLMGTSTAGIAHAAITATILDLPMGYVRSGAKDHGRGNQIDGKLLPGQKVVVVEDLISTGGSCIEVVNVLREAGADVLGIVSIFTYGMKKGLERLAAAEVKNVSLCDLDTLVEVAADKAYIAPEDKERLIKFRNNPSDESWMK